MVKVWKIIGIAVAAVCLANAAREACEFLTWEINTIV